MTDDRFLPERDRIRAAIKRERDDLALSLQMELEARRHMDRDERPLSKGRISGLTRALEILDSTP